MMWGPLLEKAWAKASGTYSQYYGNLGKAVTWAEEGIRALTGLPVITQSPGAVAQEYTNLWGNFTTGDAASYVMTAIAGSSGNSVCGLRNYGAYVVVKSF